MKRPGRCTDSELRKVNVSLLDRKELILRCDTCGRKWTLKVKEGSKKMPAHYWHCPKGCNAP